MALRPSWPSPPHEKMYSMSEAAARSEVISVPRKVSTGAAELRNAMRRSVAREKPEARAKRM